MDLAMAAARTLDSSSSVAAMKASALPMRSPAMASAEVTSSLSTVIQSSFSLSSSARSRSGSNSRTAKRRWRRARATQTACVEPPMITTRRRCSVPR